MEREVRISGIISICSLVVFESYMPSAPVEVAIILLVYLERRDEFFPDSSNNQRPPCCSWQC